MRRPRPPLHGRVFDDGGDRLAGKVSALKDRTKVAPLKAIECGGASGLLGTRSIGRTSLVGMSPLTKVGLFAMTACAGEGRA